MFARMPSRLRNLIRLQEKTFPVYAGRTATIPISNILVNDTDLGGYLPLTALSFQNPVGGTLSQSGGNVLFTSTGSAGQPASFQYTVRNRKGQKKTGVVHLTVEVPPSLVANPDTREVVQGDQVLITAASLIANDTSTNPPISVTGVQNPVGGTVTLANGNITFQSTGRSGEPAQFEYTCTDAFGNTAVGFVYMNVLQLPEIEAFIYNDSRISTRIVTAPPLNQEIFNNWYRFSHGSGHGSGANHGFPSIPTDLNTWVYDSATDTIRTTTNTESYTGFISPQKLTYYSLDVKMSSTDSDNDSITVVLAFWKDADGTEHTVSAFRTLYPNNLTPLRYWQIVYNACQPTSEVVLANGNAWADDQNAGTSGWNVYPQGVTTRFERNGPIVKCYTSRFNSTVLEPASELTFDLRNHAKTAAIANEPLQYGYGAMSQPSASFKVQTTKGALDYSTVYDIRPPSNEVYRWDAANGWVTTGQTVQQVLNYPRVVRNPETGQRFQITATSVYEIL